MAQIFPRLENALMLDLWILNHQVKKSTDETVLVIAKLPFKGQQLQFAGEKEQQSAAVKCMNAVD